MQQSIVSIQPDLVEPASTRSLDGTLDVTSYNVGGMQLEVPGGIQYHLQLTNTGEGIVLSGEASCTAMTPCARCLEPAQVYVTGEVEGYYLLEEASEIEGYESDEFEVVSEDDTIDIAPAIMAAIVYATPYIILCKDDCKGLCVTCGANLNEGPCDCDPDNEIDPLNPFVALSGLTFDDSDEE